MKPVAWMAGAGVASWAAATALAGMTAALEIALGVIGPLIVTGGFWVLAERTYRRDPARMTALMIKAFAGKMVFFGLYVAVVLAVLSVRPLPFVVTFTSAFIVLHAMEAIHLQRLFAGPSLHAHGRDLR
jgi:hypothetical protein